MKNLKVIFYVTLLFCAVMTTGHCDEIATSEDVSYNQYFGDQESFNREYDSEDNPVSQVCIGDERPIQGLYLTKPITLLKDQWIVLNEHLQPNIEITTNTGMQQFYPANDGIIVNKTGLYRISYFQRVLTKDLSSECRIALMQTPHIHPQNPRKRIQCLTFEPNKGGEIGFSQILCISAGQKLKLVFSVTSGEITLNSSSESSGLIIEEI